MRADSRTEAEVNGVLNQLVQAYARRDIDGLMSFLTPDSDLTLYGTGADEKRLGRAQFRAQAERDWSQSDAARIEWGWRQVSSAGSVAWVAADATFKATIGGDELSIPLRVTTVLEKRRNRWLIAQAHFSAPFGEQQEGASFPA